MIHDFLATLLDFLLVKIWCKICCYPTKSDLFFHKNWLITHLFVDFNRIRHSSSKKVPLLLLLQTLDMVRHLSMSTLVVFSVALQLLTDEGANQASLTRHEPLTFTNSTNPIITNHNYNTTTNHNYNQLTLVYIYIYIHIIQTKQ